MNKILRLYKVLKQCAAGKDNETATSSLTYDYGKVWTYTLALIIAAALGFLGYKLPDLAFMLPDPYAILAMLFMAGLIASAFFSAARIVNELYMSTDLSLLLTMPLSSLQIVLSKLLLVSSLPILFCLVMTVPACVGYAIAMGGALPAAFYAGMILGAVCLLIIAIALVGIIIILLMTFVNVIRNRDALRIIGAIALFIIFVAYMLIPKNDVDTNALGNVLGGIGGVAGDLPVIHGLACLLRGQVSALILLEVLGITLVLAALFFLAVRKLYLKSALRMADSSDAGADVDSRALSKATVKSNFVSAMVRRDLKSLKRNPAYLLTVFLYPIAVPILMVVIIFINGSTGEVFNAMAGFASSAVMAIAVTGLVAPSASGMSVAACSAISREGKDFDVFRQVPISWKAYIKAKEITAFILTGGIVFVYLIVAGIVMTVLAKFDPVAILLALAEAAGIILFINDMSILADIKKPNLNWDNEAVPAKSRLFPVVCYMVFLFGCGLLPLFITAFLGLVPCILLFVGLPVVLGIVGHIRLYSAGPALLEKL